MIDDRNTEVGAKLNYKDIIRENPRFEAYYRLVLIKLAVRGKVEGGGHSANPSMHLHILGESIISFIDLTSLGH